MGISHCSLLYGTRYRFREASCFSIFHFPQRPDAQCFIFHKPLFIAAAAAHASASFRPGCRKALFACTLISKPLLYFNLYIWWQIMPIFSFIDRYHLTRPPASSHFKPNARPLMPHTYRFAKSRLQQCLIEANDIFGILPFRRRSYAMSLHCLICSLFYH